MAKTEQLLRIKYIEDLLRRRKDNGASFQEVQDYLEQKFSEKGRLEDLRFTDRTFLRDKKLINDTLGVEISYSRARNAYYIHREELDIYEENIFDNLLLVEAYRETKNHGDLMIFEPRKSRGLENLNGLIHAIKHHKIIAFGYLSFWTNEQTYRLVEPYALKEFEHRWYLLAQECRPKGGVKVMKTFALDRLSDLEIKPKTFQREEYSAATAFQHSYGIIGPDGEEPQEIVLWFEAHQGNYIKSLPLHHSQEILQDDENGLRIKLFLVPTFDFKQAILSYGPRAKVLKPKSLQKEIMAEITEMQALYSSYLPAKIIRGNSASKSHLNFTPPLMHSGLDLNQINFFIHLNFSIL